MASLADSEAFELVIRPQTGWIKIDWKELVSYRELLWFLVWRDISVRYKQTILGGCMGNSSAIDNDVDFHFYLRPSCKGSL